ncbi:hypothetical protein [Cyclobacterium salsum]|uniref:hypothetical protein n=1 Tax=Cyclobacterium salsum TaxID=2666329 RepID=UPI00139132F7|nr:hypothetical protein [Cyclobacterium salsum]
MDGLPIPDGLPISEGVWLLALPEISDPLFAFDLSEDPSTLLPTFLLTKLRLLAALLILMPFCDPLDFDFSTTGISFALFSPDCPKAALSENKSINKNSKFFM